MSYWNFARLKVFGCYFASPELTARYPKGSYPPGPGTPSYEPAKVSVAQRVRILHHFGLKTGMDFAPFWSGIGYGFRGNYGSVRTYLSPQFQMNQKERVICVFEMDCKKSFRLSSCLKMIAQFLPMQGLKVGMDLRGQV